MITCKAFLLDELLLTCKRLDPGPDEDDPVFESQPGLLSNEKPKEIHNVLDVTDLVAIAPAAEYSYFMPNALAVCDGPSHWRKLRSHRATIASIKDKGIIHTCVAKMMTNVSI